MTKKEKFSMKFKFECVDRPQWNKDGITLSPEEEEEYKVYKNHFDELTYSRFALHKKIPILSILQYQQLLGIQEPDFKEVMVAFDKVFVDNQLSKRKQKASLAQTLLD